METGRIPPATRFKVTIQVALEGLIVGLSDGFFEGCFVRGFDDRTSFRFVKLIAPWIEGPSSL